MTTRCICCGTELTAGPREWIRVCPGCGLQSSRLGEPAFRADAPLGWNEAAERCLEPLRRETARRTLGMLARERPLDGARLLDVGCASGWFLDAARRRGMDPFGIEPDPAMAELGAARGCTIRVASFPDDGLERESFDVVSFNDVFEHLADPVGALDAVHRVLCDDGHLILVVPTTRGAVFRLSGLFARLGSSTVLDRVWQRDYESPHLFYFDPHNLRVLVERAGFDLAAQAPLPSLSVRGLWSRLREDGALSWPSSALVYAGTVCAYPLLRWALPSDVRLQVYRRTSRPAVSAVSGAAAPLAGMAPCERR